MMEVSPGQLLSADIGNTSISIGIFQGKRLVERFDFPTPSTQKHSLSFLKKRLKTYRIASCAIASVVPEATISLKKVLCLLTGTEPLVLGKDFCVPLKNRYRRPSEVGQDRLINAYAASKLFRAPAIIIDSGTALTFDILSRKNEYLGGMILPGLNISLQALFEKTALLPKVSLTHPKEFIGRDTVSSILSGLLWGYALLIDAMVAKIKKAIGRDATVIGTGGCIGLIACKCRQIRRVEPALTLNGLNILHRMCLTGLRNKV